MTITIKLANCFSVESQISKYFYRVVYKFLKDKFIEMGSFFSNSVIQVGN